VGRGRKSPCANIFIDRAVLGKIMDMIVDPEYENEETESLVTSFDRVSCFFVVKSKAFTLNDIPFTKDHTKLKISNGEVSLSDPTDKIAWTGKWGKRDKIDATFVIRDGSFLFDDKKNVPAGVLFIK
jgi:hypothetical protein